MRLSLSFLLLLVTLSLRAPVINVIHRHVPINVSACTTNAMTFNSLASFGNTSNFTSYATASVTPSSNAFLVLAIAETANVGPTSVTNTGANKMTWTKAKSTNYNTLGTPTAQLSVWYTQVPPTTNPPAMQVVADYGATTQSGINMHLVEFVGAVNSTDWGASALVQSVAVGSNATANPQISISAPGNNGSNAVFVAFADDVNSTTDNAAGNGTTEIAETAYNTPATGLATYRKLEAAAALTLVTNIATSRDWAAIAIEIKAGTTCGGGGGGGGGQTVTDDFNRADAADIGANWTPVVDQLQIVGNSATAFSGNDATERYSGVSWTANQSSEAKITCNAGRSVGEGFGVGVCFDAAANSGYRLVINGDGEWEVGWLGTGTFHQLASGTTTYSASAVLLLSKIGSTITSTYNGVQLDSRSDSNVASGGSPAICFSSAATGTIDDWTGKDGL